MPCSLGFFRFAALTAAASVGSMYLTLTDSGSGSEDGGAVKTQVCSQFYLLWY